MKKAWGMFITSIILASLVGCSTENGLSNNEGSGKDSNLSPDTTVIQGDKVKPLDGESPSVYLTKGPASLSVKMENGLKDEQFNVSIFKHSEGPGTITSLTSLSNRGDFSKDIKFNVPTSGYYDINVGGDWLPEDFKGSWSATVKQEKKKDSKYKQSLHVASFKEKIGGELTYENRPIDENAQDTGFTKDASLFRVLGNNTVAVGVTDDINLSVSKLENGKWTQKHKNTGKMSSLSALGEEDPFAEELYSLATDKGIAHIYLSMEKYYLIYGDNSLSKVDITPQKELLTFLEETNIKNLYWDSKHNRVYGIDELTEGSRLYQYDVKKKEFILNSEGKPLAKELPFEEIGNNVRFAIADDGTVYIGNPISGQRFDVEIMAFNKDLDQIAEPIKLTCIPNILNRGDFLMSADKNHLNVWSYYDARTWNGDHFNDPVKVGLNKYTIILQ